MGCDIHLYVERRKKLAPNDQSKNPWRSFLPKVNPGRNYALFGILANVRTRMGNPFPPKGFPQDAGYYAMSDNYYYIDDEIPDNYCVSKAKADEYVKDCGCHITEDIETGRKWVNHPDWHTHSWLATEEFKRAMEMYNRQHKNYPEVEYDALLAAMKYLEKHKCDARIVFWFDN